MIGRKTNRGNFLPYLEKTDELAFKAWAEEGSLYAARIRLARDNIRKTNGRPYSEAGVRYCAMRHMIRNFNDSKDFIVNEYIRLDLVPDIETIEQTIVGYSIEIFKDIERVRRWAEKLGLYERHEQFIIETFKKRDYLGRRRTGNPPGVQV